MKGEATISIELLDKYREMEKALKSYQENCAFKVVLKTNPYGYEDSISYHSSSNEEMKSELKSFAIERSKEIKELRIKYGNLTQEYRDRKKRIKILEEEKERLTTKLEFSERPLDISNWHFGLLGFMIACLIIFMIYIWN